MTEQNMLWLVTSVAVLILWVSSYRQFRVGGRKSVIMAVIWIAIFAVVGLVFSSMT